MDLFDFEAMWTNKCLARPSIVEYDTILSYINIYIYMVTLPPPQRSTPASSTRFPEVASLHWTLLIYAENTVNSDTIVPFAMCMQTVLLQVAGLICV